MAPAHAGFACPGGMVVVGFGAEGAPTCENVMAVAEAAMPPEPPRASAPAKSISLTSAGAIASASPETTWADLAFTLDGATLALAASCAPGPGQYAACAAGEPEPATGTVTAGDAVVLGGVSSGQTLRILDARANAVILTLVVG